MVTPDKKVIGFTMPGIECIRDFETFKLGRDCDRIDYICENLGEYGINWLMCYKDGRLVKAYNAKYVESIEYSPEEKMPEAVPF